MDIEIIVERLAVASLIPSFGLLLITMFVFQSYGLKDEKLRGWLNFWPFYKVWKEAHPVGSQWARMLTYIAIVLCLPWVLWKMMGV